MKKVNKLVFYSFLVLYLELVYKIAVYHHIWGINLIYTLLFSIPIIFIITLLDSLAKPKINKIFSFIFTSIFCIYFIFQYIFYSLFSVPFSFQTIALANQALDFTNIIAGALLKNIIMLILLLIPIVVLVIFNKKISFNQVSIRKNLICLGIIIVFYLLSILSLQFDKSHIYSVYNLYYHIKEERKSIMEFGLITATRLDIKRTIFDFKETIISENNNDSNDNNDTTIEDNNGTIKEITYNETNIDFDTLIANTNNNEIKNLLEYFKNSTSTKQNDYTGYFKDKNLIFILAEGFNQIAVDPTLTPTLYKLTHQGFVFNNFYSPVFLSTTGGEFQATTGLIPTQAILKMWKANTPNIYYALGNSFNRLNYTTNAYHDWTYSYYERNKTMPTLGFTSYTGCRNGLEKEINCKWLPSDIEMMNVTVPKYDTEEKFMTYYITVSGHAPYYMSSGNNIALKNKSYVENLPYSNSVKAYLATQIELDKALEVLINKLETDGVLDDTVIALVGDHYPYTLSTDEINEVSSYKKDGIVEVNHSNFIIWNNTMTDAIEIDKVGSQIDVLPTLLNLFGIEYDSRLIVGKDILSDYEGIAIFSDRSWVSDKGTYFANGSKFVPKNGTEVSQDYINRMNRRVANSFTVSNSIIKYDIYKQLKTED